VTIGEEYQNLRPLLFSIAYRMLSSVSEAEDIVQEAFLRYQKADRDNVESPRAYLSAVTTRLSIDHLRSARARRERYVGAWLPEPLLTDDAPGPDVRAEQADSLSMAFLLLLERLSPVERAVFLLHDVFGYDYDEIAPIVEKSRDNCRQLAVRARRHVASGRPRFEATRRKRDELAARFLGAVTDGDLDGLIGLLADDVVVYGDSGGARPSWPRPIAGRDKVARLLLGLAAQMREVGVTLARAQVNGQPGAVARDRQGRIVNVFTLDIADGAVQTIRSVISRDKLRHLGELADVPGLVKQLHQRDAGGSGSAGG
jgi:RNA polymerase sigma-70 factor (ECF subfamily)